MNDYDQLYNAFQQARSEHDKQKFNTFISTLESGLTEDLNKAYLKDKEEYERILNNIKKQGIRVFRNKKGEHKLQFM